VFSSNKVISTTSSGTLNVALEASDFTEYANLRAYAVGLLGSSLTAPSRVNGEIRTPLSPLHMAWDNHRGTNRDMVILRTLFKEECTTNEKVP
jgi:hypothetical protein